MFILILLLVCALVAVGSYAVMLQMGLVPGLSELTSGSKRQPREGQGFWPPGCLYTVILVSVVWLIGWGIVLIVALNILSSPFDN